ncbi:MAG: hypothetical protein E3K37_04460 [Candidatus Kuenenia sp.]|nr:hypothetical protein [Candidatus Kuenenia hertensis]
MNDIDAHINDLSQKLQSEDSEVVKQSLEEIGRVGRGNREAMKALQEFLKRERRMPLRVLATQIIPKVKEVSQTSVKGFKKPSVFQCPGAEKIKRVEILDIICPHCRKKGTASAAGFEHEFACESCGKMIQREIPESCIEKCPVGSECVGEDRYQKYLKGRKKPLKK